MNPQLERALLKVQKPARYVGGEYNEVIKDKEKVHTRIALCFPDTYEIGMSNLGIRILYGIANELDGVWCERVFAPWGDMEREMREVGVPLYGLESGDPIAAFDIVAFSLGYELAYTNVLNMLDLAGLPVRSEDRPDSAPLVVAGGACCYNPEPLARFIDLFIIGEGEQVNTELYAAWTAAKREGVTRGEFLARASRIEGIYVPSLYRVSYDADGTVSEIIPNGTAPLPVTKRIIQDLDGAYVPVKAVIPSTEIVHDRVALEVFRGCIRGCRFCQAGYVCRPVRSRSAGALIRSGIESLAESGYEEITLSSLSASDYRELLPLCDGLLDWCEPRSVSLSLPSLRADNFSVELMGRVQRVRKTGLTFAPEAGSQRLRDVINKNVTEEELLNTCRTAFEGGWNGVKLYFMLGLPTETDEDVLSIAALTNKVLGTWKKYAANKSRGVRITVSASCFVPKPHTPFQWEAQVTREEFQRRVDLLRGAMPKSVSFHWHSPDTSFIEAVLARGDRRLGGAVEAAWRGGARLDSWGEYFSLGRWADAFEACSIDPRFYANRERGSDEKLPWSFIDTGVNAGYLLGQRVAAYLGTTSADCRERCTACGADTLIPGGKCDE